MEVRYFRLVTGEDIIAELAGTFSSTDRQGYVIKNPLKILYMPSVRDRGSIMMSFSSWIYKSIVQDQTFDLQAHNVLVTGPVDETVFDHYGKSVASILEKQTRATETDMTPESIDFDKLGQAFEKLADMLEQEGILPPDPDSPEEIEAKDFVEDWFKNASANNKGGKLH